MSQKIIGLCGTFASGKDTLADYLVAHYHFMHLSTSDIVRQEALRLRGAIDRPVLFEVANQLRAERGAGVFVEIALELFSAHKEKYGGVVVSGIRTIGEVEMLHEKGGILLFVDAPAKLRYERMMSRKRDAETTLTFEEFQAGEVKESEVDPTNKAIQNLKAMSEMADISLINDADLESFIASGLSALQLEKK